jgi:hypothetical protein
MKRQILLLASTLAFAACGGGGSSPPPSGGGPAPTAVPTMTSPSPTPTPSATAGSVPPAEATTYSLQAADLNAYQNAVNAACPGTPTGATRFDVELLNANSNYLVSVLPGETVSQAQALAARAVSFAVSVRHALPGVGFMINPLYPTLVQNQNNAPSWWNTSANYPVFFAYYQALAQGLASNGIPYDAEANLVFPAYSGQGYSGVSLAQLEAGEAEDASNLLVAMKPQYLNVSSEPLTLSENTGQSSLDTPSGFEAWTNAIRSAIVVPAGSTTQIGAGSADWSPTSFLSAAESVPNLAYYDEHLYPPDVLTTPGGGIAQVEAINPSVTGKPGVITENWDEKDAGDAGSYGAADAQTLEQQDSYSFWAPLDAQYITTTMKFARCENLSVVDFWYVNELFAYLDYDSASAMTPTAAQDAVAQAAAAAISAGTLSPAGAAFYQGLTGSAPAARSRASAAARR